MFRFKGSEEVSGYGFELTLRLKKSEDEMEPPMWPSTLMNRLAGYVFDTGQYTGYLAVFITWESFEARQARDFTCRSTWKLPKFEPL